MALGRLLDTLSSNLGHKIIRNIQQRKGKEPLQREDDMRTHHL
jgi:hypothetical protein